MKLAKVCVFGLVVGCTASPTETETEPGSASLTWGDTELLLGPEPEGLGLTRIATGLPDLRAVCKQLRTHECASLGSGECECDHTSYQGKSGWALLELTHTSTGIEVWYPGIHTTSGWTVFASPVRNDAKIPGSFESVEWDPPKQQDLLPGGAREFVFASTNRQYTGNDSADPRATEWKTKIVCTHVLSRAQCTRPLLDEYTMRRGNADGEVYRQYYATVALGADVVVSQVSGEDQLPKHDEDYPEVLVLSPGTHALAKLLAPAPVSVGDNG
jgi:hypothetical protein